MEYAYLFIFLTVEEIAHGKLTKTYLTKTGIIVTPTKMHRRFLRRMRYKYVNLFIFLIVEEILQGKLTKA